MPVKGVELEVVEGITEHSSRVALKGVFQNFGDVVACWVPPIDRRHVDRASVRFGNGTSAEAAKMACDSGQVFLQGLPVKVDYRMGGGRRVGNSDLGESGANNEEGKARAIMDSSDRRRRSRSRRRDGSRNRDRRRSRSRERRRSRSRDRVRRDPSKDRFTEVPALPPPALAPPQDWAPPALPGAMPGTMPAAMAGAMQGPMPGPGAMPGAGALPDGVASMPPALAMVDPVAEAKKKAELAAARAERSKQLKRGPGVAALVQGALKRALTQPSVKKAEEPEQAEKPKQGGKAAQAAQEVEDESESESEQTARKKKEEHAKLEAQKKKEKEEREKAEREKAEREARERREQARREAAEAEVALQKKEAETRDQRIKASVEAAKKQQAERNAAQQAGDNLYANMPGPNLEDQVANEARAQEAAARERANQDMTHLPPEDRSKVLFLDIDGVLRPARAGGFDILSVDGEAAKSVDTSDFFPSAVKALRHIVERTAAKIVLSSEWRRSDALCGALSDVFEKNRVRAWSSKTPTTLELDTKADPVKSFAERRAREITMWLQEHEREVSGWAVLDDINLGIVDESKKSATRQLQPHLVQTWPLCGLTMGNAKTAVRILNGEMINKVVVERPVAPVGSGGAAAAGGAAAPAKK